MHVGHSFAKLGVGNRNDWKEKIISGIADHTIEPKTFAPLLFDAAALGDEAALKILSDCGRQNARDIIAVAKELSFPEGEAIPVVLLGSLYTKAKHDQIIQSLQAALRQSEYEFKLIKLSLEPVTGAVCWAMEMDGLEYDRGDIGKQIAAAIGKR